MATQYGLDLSTIEAAPDFNPRRTDSGSWNAYHTFTVVRTAWESGAKSFFARGTPITSLNQNLGDYWSFLTVEEVDIVSQRGELVEIRVLFRGIDGTETDETYDVYTLAASETEYPIETHPWFIKEISNSIEPEIVEDRVFLMGALRGEYLEAPPADGVTGIQLYKVSKGDRVSILNDTVALWYNAIFREGYKTWMAPSLEWTKQQTRSTNFTEDELALHGFVDVNVPGSPPTPSYGYFDWRKVSMNSVNTGDGFELEETWQMSLPGGWPWIYRYDLFNVDEHTSRLF